jgi:hypothetical protein
MGLAGKALIGQFDWKFSSVEITYETHALEEEWY